MKHHMLRLVLVVVASMVSVWAADATDLLKTVFAYGVAGIATGLFWTIPADYLATYLLHNNRLRRLVSFALLILLEGVILALFAAAVWFMTNALYPGFLEETNLAVSAVIFGMFFGPPSAELAKLILAKKRR